MVSMGVSFVVPRMTLMASFCTLSSFSRLDCDRVVRPRPESVTLSITQQEQMTLFDAFCIHGFQGGQSFLAPDFLLIRPASCTSAFCRSGS